MYNCGLSVQKPYSYDKIFLLAKERNVKEIDVIKAVNLLLVSDIILGHERNRSACSCEDTTSIT